MEKHNVRILVCTHKEGPVRDDDIYMPVQVDRLPLLIWAVREMMWGTI